MADPAFSAALARAMSDYKINAFLHWMTAAEIGISTTGKIEDQIVLARRFLPACFGERYVDDWVTLVMPEKRARRLGLWVAVKK